jgi:hypothetical protein
MRASQDKRTGREREHQHQNNNDGDRFHFSGLALIHKRPARRVWNRRSWASGDRGCGSGLSQVDLRSIASTRLHTFIVEECAAISAISYLVTSPASARDQFSPALFAFFIKIPEPPWFDSFLATAGTKAAGTLLSIHPTGGTYQLHSHDRPANEKNCPTSNESDQPDGAILCNKREHQPEWNREPSDHFQWDIPVSKSVGGALEFRAAITRRRTLHRFVICWHHRLIRSKKFSTGSESTASRWLHRRFRRRCFPPTRRPRAFFLAAKATRRGTSGTFLQRFFANVRTRSSGPLSARRSRVVGNAETATLALRRSERLAFAFRRGISFRDPFECSP